MSFKNGLAGDRKRNKRIDIMSLADRGPLNWDAVADEDFPAEIRDAEDSAEQIARLRAELAQPVPARLCKMGRNPPKLTKAQAESRARRAAFWRSRLLMKVTRMNKVSSMPDSFNPNEVRPLGMRIEFPDGQWVGGCPAAIDAVQDGHMQMDVICQNRKNDNIDQRLRSDLAYEGMEVVYFEKKTYSIQIVIPAAAYKPLKAATPEKVA